MSLTSRRLITVFAVIALLGRLHVAVAEEGTAPANNPSEPSLSGPSWMLTLPTADVLPQGDYVIGVAQGGTIPFHGDVGALWKDLEIGLHGAKLRIMREGSPWAAVAVGATFGYYPSGIYVVGSKTLRSMRLHVGARFLPFDFADDENDSMSAATEVASTDDGSSHSSSEATASGSNDGFLDTLEAFAGLEKEMVPGRIRLLLEVGSTLNGGFRFNVSPAWTFDVGARVGLPERIRRSIGNKGDAYAFTSRDATAYLGISYSSNWKLMGPPREDPGSTPSVSE